MRLLWRRWPTRIAEQRVPGKMYSNTFFDLLHTEKQTIHP